MGYKTTLKELSELLGLSISTVSKALADSREISECTKERVKEVAKACNYRHNKLASGFRSGRTRSVGVVVPTLMDAYYAEVLIGIEKYLTKKGYTMMVAVSHDSTSRETHVVESLSSGYVDGLIISNASETLDKQSNTSMSVPINDGIPIVLFGRPNPMVNCDQILSNFAEESFNLVEYLHKKRRCDNIALIGIEDEQFNTKSKQIGYKKAITDFGLPLPSESIIMGHRDKIAPSIRRIVTEGKYDGILCLDHESYNMLVALLTGFPKEYRDKLQIVTFGNTNLLKQIPPNAAMDLQAEKIGEITAKTLLKQILPRRNKKYCTKLVQGSLVNYNLNGSTEPISH
ncbi:MAG: LacI family DNA-binding transcriptional regulator [Bacteroidota bacterium]